MTRKGLFPILLILFLILILLVPETLCALGLSDITDTLSNIKSTLTELKETVYGIGAVFRALDYFTSTIGFSTILLFLVVAAISSALRIIGIPRGKISFLISLVIANFLWLSLNNSFNPDTSGFSNSMIKANAILIGPAFLIMLFRFLYPRIKKMTGSALKRGKALSPDRAAMLLREYQELSASFNGRALEEIISAKESGEMRFSSEIRHQREELIRILDSIGSKEKT